ncbi:MAG TPA: Uma2 family endonuclease [Phycisphaerales bacterium]|nr:Uma2 family endonuclease [Phycisphaerales bacterium]
MLSEHVPRRDAGFAGLLMSAEEYFALGETEERYELVNGVVVMSPSPTPRHWRFVREILGQLDSFCGPNAIDPYSETDIRVASSMVLRPDLCVYLRPPSERVPDRLVEPPDLVVEISSPGNKSYDLQTKHGAYERFGVKEYWMVDPWDPHEPPGMRVRAWRLERGAYVDMEVGADRLVSRVIDGFSLDLGRLRRLAGV